MWMGRYRHMPFIDTQNCQWGAHILPTFSVHPVPYMLSLRILLTVMLFS